MPNAATLIAGVKATVVTRQQLQGIHPPRPTHSHRPIAHADLVETMEASLQRAGYTIVREQYAVQTKGLRLFGTFDLENGTTAAPNTTLAIGFRHDNAKRMSLQAVSGARVTVCSNLVLAGDQKLFRLIHRHGVMAHLRESLDRYFGAYHTQIEMLRDRFGVWQASPLENVSAKALVFDAVYQGIIPARLLDDVATNYFRAPDLGYPDCVPRTKWGLSNSFTRAFKTLAPAPAYTAQLGLTRLLLDEVTR